MGLNACCRRRRSLAGLMLLAMLPAHAAAPQPEEGAATATARSAAAVPARTRPGIGVLAAFKQHALTLLPIFSTHPFSSLPGPVALRNDLDALRERYGIRVVPPDPGTVYVDVFRNADTASITRWLPAVDGTALPESRDRAWQADALQDLTKPDRNSLRQVRFVPQLIMNVTELVGTPGHMQLGFTYRSWDCPDSGALPDVRPMPQLSLRWTYR